jgi:hypothetical protein
MVERSVTLLWSIEHAVAVVAPFALFHSDGKTAVVTVQAL